MKESTEESHFTTEARRAQRKHQLAALGYTDYQWSLPGGWFGYTSAHKTDKNTKGEKR